jgi:catechol 2,3-dioxygenase-like lactoylglutathione lyase family enzyme
MCVRDVDAWARFFVEVGGLEILHRGNTPERTLEAWPEPRPSAGREVLLGRPGVAQGRIRLYGFTGVAQEEIRGGAMPWDTGGIFDLDFRVADLRAQHERLTGLGWGGFSEPVDWRFGDLRVREWLALGPEAVCLALMQRLEPPLPDGAVPAGFSQAFNSSQTVRDMDEAVAFYERLGFRIVLEQRAPLAEGGGRVLGLLPEEADDTVVELVILHPERKLEGSVELVAFPGRPGRRLGHRALPTQLGINLLRFPVDGLERLAAALDRPENPMPRGPIHRAALAPFGDVRMLSLQSPDGAWLEFFEHA